VRAFAPEANTRRARRVRATLGAEARASVRIEATSL
jgi:hypothetical protein